MSYFRLVPGPMPGPCTRPPATCTTHEHGAAWNFAIGIFRLDLPLDLRLPPARMQLAWALRAGRSKCELAQLAYDNAAQLPHAQASRGPLAPYTSANCHCAMQVSPNGAHVHAPGMAIGLHPVWGVPSDADMPPRLRARCPHPYSGRAPVLIRT